MRLINTATGLFEEFITRNVPKYAILSHTWEEEEVSFSDMQKDGHQAKKGFEKIRMTCKLAADAGIQYAWVDTCCIDKSSSAELTEAINSMYRWYQRSAICYAYLSDLSPSDSLDTALPFCRWFTRGWTLQELIAPSEMRFFDRSWIDRGSKKSLCTKLSAITAIDTKVLRHELHLSSIAIAQRMSWAAKRETTRIEDRSYSLLGLFGVHMPMIYGEEERAFRRLQEEIIKSTLDMSIFAWKMPEHTKPLDYPGTQYVCGVLASSPDDFWDSTAMTSIPSTSTNEFSLSSKGIRSHARCENSEAKLGASVLPLGFEKFRRNFLTTPYPIGQTMSIRITRCGFDQFVRQDPWSLLAGILIPSEAQAKPHTEYFLSELPDTNEGDSEGTRYCAKASFLADRRYSVLQLQLPVQTGVSIAYLDGWPQGRWDEEGHLFFVRSSSHWGLCGASFAIHWEKQPMTPLQYSLLANNFWASNIPGGSESAFQFGIFDAERFNPPDRRLPGQADWEFQAKINDWIREVKAPRATQVVTEIPRTGLVAVLSVKYSHVEDEDVCMNPFRRLQLHFEIMEAEKAPIPLHLEWDFNTV